MQNKHKCFLLLLGCLLIFIDQTVKILCARYLPSSVSYNRGGAFSIAEGFSLYSVMAFGITLLVLTIFFLAKDKNKFPLLLIACGAVSNQIDRFVKPGVVDFIDFKIWPSFNLADSYIFVGICIILYSLLKTRSI